MPISDYLLALALTLHPGTGANGAVVLGPDALVQPLGGAMIQREAADSASDKTRPIKPADKTRPLKPADKTIQTSSIKKKPYIIKDDSVRKPDHK